MSENVKEMTERKKTLRIGTEGINNSIPLLHIYNRVTSNWLFYTSRAIGTLSCVAKSGLVAREWRGRMGCLLLERQ
jgi:hypothetical protein